MTGRAAGCRREIAGRNWKHEALVLALLFVAATACASDAADDTPLTRDSALRAELLALSEQDQQAREGSGEAFARQDTVFLKRMMSGDSARARRLREIIGASGWPTVAQVGTDGVRAAWLLLQHSPYIEMQADLLPLLDSAAARGEVPPGDVAMLTDRVLVRQGRPQRYGNSFSGVGGKLVPDSIEDPSKLDSLRRSVGLPPMTEYVKLLEAEYRLPVVWPP